MRKTFLTLLGLVLTISLYAQQGTYTVRADFNTWLAIIRVIDTSAASNLEVRAAKDFIVRQVDAQIMAERAKAKSDTNKILQHKPGERGKKK